MEPTFHRRKATNWGAQIILVGECCSWPLAHGQTFHCRQKYGGDFLKKIKNVSTSEKNVLPIAILCWAKWLPFFEMKKNCNIHLLFWKNICFSPTSFFQRVKLSFCTDETWKKIVQKKKREARGIKGRDYLHERRFDNCWNRSTQKNQVEREAIEASEQHTTCTYDNHSK